MTKMSVVFMIWVMILVSLHTFSVLSNVGAEWFGIIPR